MILSPNPCTLAENQWSDVVSFGTEAGLFQKAGVSAVICGPGSIEQAHKPDEYVEYCSLSVRVYIVYCLLTIFSHISLLRE